MTVHGHWAAWIHWPQLQVAITCQHHLATKPSADKVKSLWLPPCTTTSPRQTKWVGEMIGFKRHLSLHYLILSLQYCKRSFCSCNFPICHRHIRIIQNLTISDSFFETSRHTNPSLTIYPALIAAHPGDWMSGPRWCYPFGFYLWMTEVRRLSFCAWPSSSSAECHSEKPKIWWAAAFAHAGSVFDWLDGDIGRTGLLGTFIPKGNSKHEVVSSEYFKDQAGGCDAIFKEVHDALMCWGTYFGPCSMHWTSSQFTRWANPEPRIPRLLADSCTFKTPCKQWPCDRETLHSNDQT